MLHIVGRIRCLAAVSIVLTFKPLLIRNQESTQAATPQYRLASPRPCARQDNPDPSFMQAAWLCLALPTNICAPRLPRARCLAVAQC